MTPELKTKQDELEAIRRELKLISGTLKTLARQAAQADADYENAKNQSIIRMNVEETSEEWITAKKKRTDQIREAIYRTENADLRLARGLAKADVDSTKSYIHSLELMQSNLQTQIRLESTVEEL